MRYERKAVFCTNEIVFWNIIVITIVARYIFPLRTYTYIIIKICGNIKISPSIIPQNDLISISGSMNKKYWGTRICSNGFLFDKIAVLKSHYARFCYCLHHRGIVFPLPHGGVLCHGISPIRSEGADGQKRDCHHQRQQEGNDSLFHPVIFLSLS